MAFPEEDARPKKGVSYRGSTQLCLTKMNEEIKQLRKSQEKLIEKSIKNSVLKIDTRKKHLKSLS